MRERHTRGRGDQHAEWVEGLFDRVGDAAWRLARRSMPDDAAASELVVRAFRAFAETDRRQDIELLQCVLDHIRLARPQLAEDAPDMERRTSTDMRDAFELVYVAGAPVAQVAALLGCTTNELARRMLDAACQRDLARAH